jgi:hypothetical protein
VSYRRFAAHVHPGSLISFSSIGPRDLSCRLEGGTMDWLFKALLMAGMVLLVMVAARKGAVD